MPNLLSRRWGRLAAFTWLYVCEGLPNGFAMVAVSLELKRMGLDAAALGSLAAWALFPWAWKWLAGPIVDNLHLPGLGRRKQWIVACQLGLVGSLVAAILLFPRVEGTGVGGLATFTALLVLANAFAACQDVAIDALAVGTLDESETGLANGLMFAGAQGGAAIGGSAVLALKGVVGFGAAMWLAPAVLAALLVATVLFVREPPHVARPGPVFARVTREVASYVRTVVSSVLLTRSGLLGIVLAILPFGGMALSLTLSTVIAPTLGMTDNEIASLGLVSSAVFMACCLLGGWLSDRFGRIRTLTVFSLLTLLPTAWLAWELHAAGFDLPTPPGPDGTWPRAEALITAWWIAQVTYTVAQGLMYGIRTAMFMDVADPRIAATQFTAYMALLNVSTQLSFWWEGQALTSVADGGWGITYTQTLLLDCGIGAVFVLLVPFIPSRAAARAEAGI
jgi:MFS transporter, PAT family, beta-lactamase induction signal transducer AmpG